MPKSAVFRGKRKKNSAADDSKFCTGHYWEGGRCGHLVIGSTFNFGQDLIDGALIAEDKIIDANSDYEIADVNAYVAGMHTLRYSFSSAATIIALNAAEAARPAKIDAIETARAASHVQALSTHDMEFAELEDDRDEGLDSAANERDSRLDDAWQQYVDATAPNSHDYKYLPVVDSWDRVTLGVSAQRVTFSNDVPMTLVDRITTANAFDDNHSWAGYDHGYGYGYGSRQVSGIASSAFANTGGQSVLEVWRYTTSSFNLNIRDTLRQLPSGDHLVGYYGIGEAWVLGQWQGYANLANGLQDSIVGIANLPAFAFNTLSSAGEWLYGMDIADPLRFEYFYSPDWSRNLFVYETEASHGASKFLSALGVEMLTQTWITRLGHAGSFGALRQQVQGLKEAGVTTASARRALIEGVENAPRAGGFLENNLRFAPGYAQGLANRGLRKAFKKEISRLGVTTRFVTEGGSSFNPVTRVATINKLTATPGTLLDEFAHAFSRVHGKGKYLPADLAKRHRALAREVRLVGSTDGLGTAKNTLYHQLELANFLRSGTARPGFLRVIPWEEIEKFLAIEALPGVRVGL